VGQVINARRVAAAPVAGVATGVTVALFGDIQVTDGERRLGPRDFGGVKPKQVLEVLLSARGRPVSKGQLGDWLWEDRLPKNLAATLETYISVVRRAIAPDGSRGRDLVVTGRESYRFDVERVDLDLDRFDSLLAFGRKAKTLHGSRGFYERALALASADVFADEPYAPWAEALRDEYRVRVNDTRLEVARIALEQEDAKGALDHAEAALVDDRFSEPAYGAAMLALYALGRQKDALDLFQRCRKLLDDELGIEPMAETKALYTSILRQETVESLLPAVEPVAIAVAQDGDAASVPFLGRVKELAIFEGVVERGLAGNCVIGLVAAEAGIGKSRLLDEVVARIGEARIGRARCSALESSLPYVPLAFALRDALGEDEIDVESMPALAEILPELRLGTPGAAFSDLSGLEALIELIRKNAPFVLVLDDLQWADASTMTAISYIQHRCAEAPVIILGGFRPDGVGADHPIRRLDAVGVRLEALTAKDLAAAHIPGLFETTGGHPELVAAALHEGTVEEISPSVKERIIARCRLGGSESYKILVCAAILPQPFSAWSIARMVLMDGDVVATELERLCERGLLEVRSDGDYAFTSSAVHECLCNAASPARRQLQRRREVELHAGLHEGVRTLSARRRIHAV
jgi:DNA-binding SARP family transcriptional activator